MSESDRQIFLGMPGYGDMTAGAARGFWRASRLPDSQVCYEYREGSLLAANFNALWCSALNRVHRGQRLDYLAMQHADVEPQDWWLDALIDELEAKNLDILGCVVPIKDSHGTTSLALARDDGDDWRPLCRLTMTEVFRLPETFTSEDIGHPLLLNTGLWVCRFDPAWVKKLHFEINDRIVFDRKADCYRAQVEPEDWYFSRLCHELGLRIGATRKIALTHRGHASFANVRPWGEPYDSAWVDSSPVPDDLPGFRFPADVDGWLRYDEGRELAKLADGKYVLEVGSYCGASTICLAQTALYVCSIDPHDGRGTPIPQDTKLKLQTNLSRYGLSDRVVVRVGTLREHAPILSDLRYDLIFIDGAHDRESVASDIEHSLKLLTDDGLLVFHDYRSPDDPGVTEAVDALLATGATLISVCNSLAAVRPASHVPQSLEV